MANIFIYFLTALSAVSAAQISQCQRTGRVNMNNIKITGCSPNKNDCVFARGEDAEIQIPFTTSNSPEKLTAIVHGILFGIPIPFSLPNNDACVDSGLSCPVPKNTEVIYTTKIPVRKEYPSLRVTVQMKLRDENGDDVTCIKFPVRLV